MIGLNWIEIGWCENYILFDSELIPNLCLVVGAERRLGLDDPGEVKDGRRGLEREKNRNGAVNAGTRFESWLWLSVTSEF